jgi:hypothetical protein
VARAQQVRAALAARFIEHAADLLAPIDGLHWKQLLASSWMATDGTGIKVLIPKLPTAHNGYIELYRNHEHAVSLTRPTRTATTSPPSFVRSAGRSPRTPSIASTPCSNRAT